MSFLEQIPDQLRSEILKICDSNNDALLTFEKLHTYLSSTESDTKKRKLATVISSSTTSIDSISTDSIVFQLSEVSFQSPFRKKLNLTLSISPLSQKPIISIAKANDIKPELIIKDLTKTNIPFFTILPVPEKPKQLYLIISYLKTSDSNEHGETTKPEPIVITINTDTLTKQFQANKIMKSPTDSLRVLLQRQFQIIGLKLLDPFSNPQIDSSSSSYFTAYRGTKEGTMYLLPQHILFGFKKPILLYQTSQISNVSYINITRLTFSVVLELADGEKIEFSMIDQTEFEVIERFVKGLGVNDLSMSDALKAKVSITKNNEKLEEEEEEEVEADADNGEEGLHTDDEEEDDGDFNMEVEIDDTSDVSSEEEGHSGGEGPEEHSDNEEDDEDEDGPQMAEEEEDEEIELNSDDD